MAEVIKETRAGPITERVAYTRIECGDSAVARAEKGKCSTLARKKTNHRVMQRSLGLLMATNFKLEDFFLTLTFDNDHLPRTRRGAMKAVKEFVRLLKRHRLLRKQDLKYIYCIENKHDAGRYHIHMVMNAVGRDVEAIISLWSYGLVDWEFIGWEKKTREADIQRHKGV